MTADELWDRALQELQLVTTRPTFDTWLRGSRGLDQDNGTLTVGVRHAFAIDWLTHRMMPVIQRAVSNANGDGLGIRFVVASGSELSRGAETRRKSAEPAIREPVFEAVREERVAHDGQGGALVWTDFYIKLKVAFRKSALARLKGAKLSVFLCLALHVDRDGTAYPGIDEIMQETGYGRATIISALGELESLGLIRKCDRRHPRSRDRYEVCGYAWFGKEPAPSLWELPGESEE